MHDDRALVEERITRELHERVVPLIEREHRPMRITAGQDRDRQSEFRIGDSWGVPWGTTWFTLAGDLPDAWAGGRVDAFIDLGFRGDAAGFQCEGLIVDADGRPVQGIHPRRIRHRLEPTPGPVTVLLEAASNPSFPPCRPSPLGSPDSGDERHLYRFRRADLVLVHPAAEALAQMNERKITCLFVVDEDDAARRPLGILHIHDCLRAGVA